MSLTFLYLYILNDNYATKNIMSMDHLLNASIKSKRTYVSIKT